ncbi:protein ROLLING AND ERECT LEAF 2-like [Phragmites australis]|uniref:protein ROLLING AND ERECT LEAF 2-like n=1 Tax=Phragmites australis TaxID=29695 RepID=UPI002D792EB2|nr:protein ROLLING AND ERECT LEAF 2-like [Phragmites australis]
MGCTTSRDAFSAAVTSRARRSSSSRPRGADPAALCRQRVALIRAAADTRFTLAAAHAAYFRSLAAVGDALRRFAAAALAPATPSPGSSPVLTLPPSPAKPVAASAATASSLPPSTSSSSTVSSLSHSLSDENLEAPPDAKHGGSEKAPSSTKHHYMRGSSTVPTVVYEDPNAQAQYTEGETSYGYGYGYSYPYGPYGEVVAEERPETAAPRPLPSPPTAEASPWDFFDPFTQYDQFLEDYSHGNLPTNSPNYAELRRMEGIPELEDEAELEAKAEAEASKPSTSGVAHQNVKGKEPILENAASHGEPSGAKMQRTGSEPVPVAKLQRKASEPAPGANGKAGQPVSRNDSVPSNASYKSKEGGKRNTASLKGTVSGDIDGNSSSGKKQAVAFDEEGSITAAEGGGESHGKSVQSAVSSESFSPLHHARRDVREAMDEVKGLFDEAVNCSAEVSRLLEVGMVRRRTTPRVLRYISSKVGDPLGLTVSTSSCLPKPHGRKSRASSSKASTSASSGTGRRNGVGKLSSTLEKLYAWEKKLYQEIKDEEKLQMQYEKKYRRLKSLDEGGAESSTIDSTRLSVRLLRSKISISIRTANAFSSKIEKIRDEELYPQLVDLIQRFRRLWKVVLECHEKQLLAIQDSKIHRLKAITISQSSVASMASVELGRELTRWYRCFNKWISSQRSYIEALNGWLRKWLPEVQEEVTADGIPPFSPGRLGAPPVFVISNDWLQGIDRISKNEVLRAMDHFSKLVHQFKKSLEDEQRQKRKADHASRDYNKKREDLQGELGLSTSLDLVAVMENPRYSHDDRVMDMEKARKRRDEERVRHENILNHAHIAASATLPIGLIPMLQQITSFFQGNLQVYTQIRIQGT